MYVVHINNQPTRLVFPKKKALEFVKSFVGHEVKLPKGSPKYVDWRNGNTGSVGLKKRK